MWLVHWGGQNNVKFSVVFKSTEKNQKTLRTLGMFTQIWFSTILILVFGVILNIYMTFSLILAFSIHDTIFKITLYSFELFIEIFSFQYC